MIQETFPGSEYAIHMAGKSEGARLFVSRFKMLDHLATLLPEGPVAAEIGVFHGHFSARLLQILKPSKLHLIDTFCTNDHISGAFTAVGHHSFVAERFKVQKDADIVVMHQGMSWDRIAMLKDASIDYLYIDADHTYASVKRDIDAALPKVRAGGIVQFNDYTNAHGYGVLDAVNEFIEVSPNIELLGMSLDRSGYHDLAIRVLSTPTKKNKLSIVTACSRPENLIALRDSIRFDLIDVWYVVHDTRTRPFMRVFPEGNPKIVELECKDKGVVGHQIRNFALDNLVKDGIIYFLDDDNIIHEDFWKLDLAPGKLHTFDMQYSDARVLKGDTLAVSKIDTAQFAFDVALIPSDMRFDTSDYGADGLFIVALSKEIDCVITHAYHKGVAAWYNRLRSPPPLPTHDPFQRMSIL